jgi:hypothetical protein
MQNQRDRRRVHGCPFGKASGVAKQALLFLKKKKQKDFF